MRALLPTEAKILSLAIALGAAVPMGAHAQTPPAAAPQPAPTVAQASVVEPESVAALQRMSAFLSSLNTFRLTANTTRDVVTNDGQRLQIDSVAQFTVKRPGFVIDVNNDLKPRRYIYDGKQFTVYSQKLGFYATIPAPPTNREMLDQLYEDYGISIPLEDLFRWNDPAGTRSGALTSGFSVGTATIDGAPTDHYAFRQGDLDWEIWIEKGDRPIPRKLTIVDRTDSAQPAYTARLSWTLNPPLTASDFAFTPDKDAKRIGIATLRTARLRPGGTQEK